MVYSQLGKCYYAGDFGFQTFNIMKIPETLKSTIMFLSIAPNII
jgi:hypothetical protein